MTFALSLAAEQAGKVAIIIGATIRRCVNSIGGEYPSGLI